MLLSNKSISYFPIRNLTLNSSIPTNGYYAFLISINSFQNAVIICFIFYNSLRIFGEEKKWLIPKLVENFLFSFTSRGRILYFFLISVLCLAIHGLFVGLVCLKEYQHIIFNIEILISCEHSKNLLLVNFFNVFLIWKWIAGIFYFIFYYENVLLAIFNFFSLWKYIAGNFLFFSMKMYYGLF